MDRVVNIAANDEVKWIAIAQNYRGIDIEDRIQEFSYVWDRFEQVIIWIE